MRVDVGWRRASFCCLRGRRTDEEGGTVTDVLDSLLTSCEGGGGDPLARRRRIDRLCEKKEIYSKVRQIEIFFVSACLYTVLLKDLPLTVQNRDGRSLSAFYLK